MIGRIWRSVLKFLASPKLALVLIVFVGAWSTLATIVPQGDPAAADIAAWTAEKAVVGPVVAFVGLHEAFSAPVFLAAAILLALSTAVCSWNRTIVALKRGRTLRAAQASTAASVGARHDFEIACDPALSEAEVLDRASDALGTLGIKTRRSDSVISSVSAPWTVWGSPIFHWALVVFALAAFAGVLLRAEGLMAIAVGDAKEDKPPSYSRIEEGVWHDWDRVERSIRVDSFEPGIVKDGLDLGAVPTVSVLDADGTVLATQQVYPNNKLHAGSLSINAPACGLSATIQLTAPSGSALPPVTQLVDFSQESTAGTIPVAPLVLSDGEGDVVLRMDARVPLDRIEDGSFGEWIPEQPSAIVYIEDGSGAVLFDEQIMVGEEKALPGGGSVKLVDVGWYSLLSLVDDPSIPFVYASMIVAMLGLTLSLVCRQQLFAATVIDGPEGCMLAVSVRVWRNGAASRDEIEAELTRALGSSPEGSAS